MLTLIFSVFYSKIAGLSVNKCAFRRVKRLILYLPNGSDCIFLYLGVFMKSVLIFGVVLYCLVLDLLLLKLTTFEKAKESWEMNSAEKLEQSIIIKEKGTQYFKEGKHRQASVQYKRIVSWLENESSLPEGEDQKAKALRLAAHLNLAMCFIKLQEPSSAFDNCDKALELDESNEKALFRRGEALFAMKEFDRARADFQRVTQLYPSNKAAKSQVALCQKQIKEQHEKDKRLYANMFQKFAERDAKKEADKGMENIGGMDVEESGGQE